MEIIIKVNGKRYLINNEIFQRIVELIEFRAAKSDDDGANPWKQVLGDMKACDSWDE